MFTPRRVPGSRVGLSVAIALGASVIAAGCGSDAEPVPTDEELLEAIAGEPLSPAEVASKLDTADVLCGLDADVLERIWIQLEPEQFEFQEFAFSHRCPQREVEFITGRDAAATARAARTTTTATQRSTTTQRTTSSQRSTTTQRTTSSQRTTTTRPNTATSSTTTRPNTSTSSRAS